MDNDWLLRTFITEVLVDASGSFLARRRQAFREKLRGLAGEFPSLFRRQEEQEREVNAQLAAIRSIPDRHVNRKRLRVAAPSLYDDSKSEDGVGWGVDTPVFTILAHDGDNPELRRFVQSNSSAFLAAAAEVDSEMKAIEDFADSMRWPAPWRRYTRHSSVVHEVWRFKENLKKLLKAT